MFGLFARRKLPSISLVVIGSSETQRYNCWLMVIEKAAASKPLGLGAA